MKKFILLCIVAFSQFAIAEPITMMTFNIRYASANDGENNWEYRKAHVVETIRDANPSVIAIQEALLGQLEYIDEHLPQFKKIGQHRSGNTKGEFSGLLIDTSKLEWLSDGQIWLSETPEEISTGWDAAMERTATWVTVRKVGTSSPSMLLWSTHFDHRGSQARFESAKLIVTTSKEVSEGKIPVAIMGDFNSTLGSAPCKIFAAAGFVPAVQSSGGTFHEFTGSESVPRIDFIFLNDKWVTESAEILRPRKKGKCASDHDPVVAKVFSKLSMAILFSVTERKMMPCSLRLLFNSSVNLFNCSFFSEISPSICSIFPISLISLFSLSKV
mgnify:CR=1 FL=1